MAPVSAADLHCNSQVTFAIQSQQVSAFAINTTSGALSVVNPSLLDYESYPPNPHIISVTVSVCTPYPTALATLSGLVTKGIYGMGN